MRDSHACVKIFTPKGSLRILQLSIHWILGHFVSGMEFAEGIFVGMEPAKYITKANCWITVGILLLCMNSEAQTKVSPALVPATGTFYLMSAGNDGPPLPFNPYPGCTVYSLGDGRYAIDDLAVAAAKEALSQQQTMSADDSGPPGPPGGGGTNSGGGGVISYGAPFSTNGLWIEVIGINTNYNWLSLRLHNTTNSMYYELGIKTNLTDPAWTWNYIQYGSDGYVDIDYLPMTASNQFYRAVGGITTDGIESGSGTVATKPCSPTDSGESFPIYLGIYPSLGINITLVWQLGGSAAYGKDYILTNVTYGGLVTNSVVMPAGQTDIEVDLIPLYNTNATFNETFTMNMLATNGCIVYPGDSSLAATINECPSNNYFTVVTNLSEPIGIDYSPTLQSLLVSFNYPYGETNNFARIYTNAATGALIVTNWTTINGMYDEIKIATVKQTANGFTNGDAYYGNGNAGGIGWMSANGATWNTNWLTLSSSHYLRGSLYVDQTGTFSNNLIVVTGDSSDDDTNEEVWEIAANKTANLLATPSASHLEGVITLTNDPAKWGPWAGKIITGDESAIPDPLIYTIDTNGVVTTYDTTTLFPGGIHTEDFDLIPTNQDVYCVNYDDEYPPNSRILKLSHTLLNKYVGSLLITDAGEVSPPAKLFIVNWNGTNFVVRSISGGSITHFEHVTFAPINLPSTSLQ